MTPAHDWRRKPNRFEVIPDPDGAYVAVELTKGQWAQVDVDDWFGRLDAYAWHAFWRYKKFYVAARSKTGGHNILIHRLVLDATDPKVEVDHRNGDALNNRKSNLRLCNKYQNMWNIGKTVRNRSGYVGVNWNKIHRKWVAAITCHGKRKWLGNYDDPAIAAKVRDKEALAKHGEFAYLNFPLEAMS